MQPVPASPAPHPALRRSLGRFDLLGLFINTFVGAGIFGLPARVFELTGAYSLLAFVACGALVMLIVACFAEVASRFARTGGAYLYTLQAFGPTLGFQVGWLMWITRVTAFATVCNLLVVYMGFFWAPATAPTFRALLISAVVVVLSAVNWLGIRQTAWVSNVFTVGKLIPLLLFVVVGLWAMEPGQITFHAAPEHEQFALAIVVLVFAFSGFEVTTISAGEAKNPSRDYPFALFASLGFVIVLYVLIQWVCIATLPELGQSQRPLVDAATVFLGNAGGVLIAGGAIVSMIGTLNATLLGCTRLPFALAENNQAPALFAGINARFQTPTVSIAVSAILIWVASVSYSFVAALTISSITKLMTYVVVCAAMLALRRQTSLDAPFKVPFGEVIVVCAIALCLWLLASSAWQEMLQITLAMLVGTALYAMHRHFVASTTDAR